MSKDIKDIPTTKVTNTYKVNFGYASPTGQIRQAARLIKAKDITEARNIAVNTIKEEFDWFKITKIIETTSDHPQQTL